MPGDDERLANQLKNYASVRNEPSNYTYEPPKGRPILELPPEAKIYQLDEPTRQTDLLAAYERRHVIPIAMMIAPIFDVVPVPDDVYRAAPEYAKNNLFCVISRSGITRDGKVLNWDSVVVVVQRLCVVRINCDLEPQADRFTIRRVFLWTQRLQRYELIQDPEAPNIDPSVLPYVLDRYVAVEGIS